jgi:cytochrome b
VLLALVGVQVGTGLFVSDDVFWAGPYNGAVSGATARQLTAIHKLNFTILQGAVAVHVLAIIAYAWLRRENLTSPMLSGYKPTADGADDGIDDSRVALALCVLVAVAGGVWLLVELAPPPPVIDFM